MATVPWKCSSCGECKNRGSAEKNLFQKSWKGENNICESFLTTLK